MTRHRRTGSCVLFIMFLIYSYTIVTFANGDYIAEPSGSDFVLVESDSDAESLGVTVVPLQVHSKSLHPYGSFVFRLIIRVQEKLNADCSADYSLVVLSHEYEEILAESLSFIDSQGMSREYTLQRPNMMKLYLTVGATCVQNLLEAEGQIFALDINKIYEGIVTTEKQEMN